MDGSDVLTFGAWLRLRRRQLDLTQSDLANRVGCSVMMIRKIESGERRPSRQIAGLMAAALEVPEQQQEEFVRAARQSIYVTRESLAGEADSLPPLPGAPALEPAPRPPARPPLTLPHYPGAFIGRSAEREQVVQLLAGGDCRLLTLTGPGGIGKTRLAVEALQAFEGQADPVFPDGVVYIPLAPLRSADLIPPALARALGFSFHEGADPLGQLITYLQDQVLLIALDNFEHLLEGADLLAALLARTPGVALLVTSRQRLALSGEWVLEISGLAYPPPTVAGELDGELSAEYSAVQLFLESARRVRSDFSLNPGSAAAIQQICQLVDGMPLGIELAAAWLRTLPAAEVASEIQRSLDFLTSSARDLPERHRSLRAAFEHSWFLLTAEEQAAFARLSVFRGGFSRPAAAQVAGAGLPVLASLLDKSLLRRQGERYFIHELLRQYAEGKLAEMPDQLRATRQAHAGMYAERLADWGAALRGREQIEALLEMDGEVDNLRAAWHCLCANQAVESLREAWFGLWFYWETRFLFQEGAALFAELAAALDGAEVGGARELRAGAQACVAWFEMRRLRPEAVRELVGEAYAALAAGPDTSLSLFAGLPLAFIVLRLGDMPRCQELLEDVHHRAGRIGDRWLQAVCGHELCSLYIYRGRYHQAEELGLGTLALAQEIGEPRRLMIISYHLANLYTRLGEHERAQYYLDRSLVLTEEVGDIRYLAHLLRIRSQYALSLGEIDAAAEDAQQALEISERIGDPMVVFAGQLAVGQVELQAGNLQDAADFFLQAYRLGREYRLETLQVNALLYLAATAWREGSHAEAAALALRLEPEVQDDQELARLAADLRRAAGEQFSAEYLEKLAHEACQASLEALLARLSLGV